MAAKERTKENCRCFDAADPRLGGCTPPRPPKRKSEGAGAKRKQYYFSFLTPPPLPPPLSRVFPRTPAGGRQRPPCQRGLAAPAAWGIPTGLAGLPVTPADGRESLRLACARHLPLTREASLAGFARAKRLPSQGSWPSLRGLRGFDGPYVTTRFPGQPRPLRRGGLPPSLAPLVHNPLTFTYRQPPEPLRPASRPPPLMGRLLPRASPAQKRPPCQRGLAALAAWGISTGLAGLPVTPADGQESLRLACARHLPLTREASLAGFARAKRLPIRGAGRACEA